MAAPPVVKFLDFGQYKYELTKREKEAKRRQRSVTFKEVRLSPKIGIGDFDTKVHRAIEFLEDGDRIKVTVRFRGRELTHPELGRNMLARFTDRIKEHGVAERAPLLEGKSMHITVASVHKPKEHEVAGKPPTARRARPTNRRHRPTPGAATRQRRAGRRGAGTGRRRRSGSSRSQPPRRPAPAASRSQPRQRPAEAEAHRPRRGSNSRQPPEPAAAAAAAAATRPAKAAARRSRDTPAARPAGSDRRVRPGCPR